MTGAADGITMKTTWTLAVSALTAIFAGTAIAASAAEPDALPYEVAHTERPAAPVISLPDVPLLPVAGDTIPADAVDATREAGLDVFVSPRGDGSGIVVDPRAPLP